MKFSKLFLVALSVSLFVSCSNDDNNNNDDTPKGVYDNGFFILNEGTTKGTVSFSSDDLTSSTKDIYAAANGTDVLGKFVQNIFFSGDNAYIISGGANNITVVNRYTFKLITKIETGLKNPRYGVVKDGKAYVTNANTYSYENAATGDTDDYVAIINLATNTYESKIDLNTTANRVVLKDGKLYITDSYSDKLSIVDIATKKLDTPVQIGKTGDCIEEENGILYILKGGYGNSSGLVKVKITDKTFTEFAFPESLKEAGFMDVNDSKIYYTVGSAVYVINTNATAPSTTPLLTSAATNIYGFAVKNNRIYVAQGNFKADGTAYVYNLTGALQKEIATGIGSNGFYFND
ncbi:hypothetical protein C8C83_2895 [Flavobacterium sp. 90]|uniref:YncE family protein n=1 Tax=Flavobacterium sp. 90 TaxID=2135622 RepID=UPI000F199FDA|nr:hypothetical protein [Flavobacterium sp. 90]RKR11195.1 LOW QUALITY PROTEIN: hypothetical protein C8C82_3205 [Flavobacterium sp. 81]TCK54976.1 hypothetical protein C8C83_2895 [Flavobacterium sp. 90]